MHKLLRRQLRKHLGTDDAAPFSPQWRALLSAVEQAYEQADNDRMLLERSLELTSQDLMARYEELRTSNARELLARNADLRRSNAELEQFAYVASHDLQEPLRTITSYIQLLERKYRSAFDETGLRYLAYVVDGAKRMRALINALLAFSRVGKGVATFESVEVKDAVDEACANLSVAIREAAASIEVLPLPPVRADRIQLVQLLENLIGNAVKYRGDAPPSIVIGGSSAGSTQRLWVQDNGIGIDPKHAERVFQIFQRLHERDKYEGTGIGLAIAKKIVERHGGRIWVESTPGSGATFVFELPREGPSGLPPARP